MAQIMQPDFSVLDRPEILAVLFHPRPETSPPSAEAAGLEIQIPVDDGVVLGARFHLGAKSDPNILFFHGNGEIVADYNDLGTLYTAQGINFLPVDYRGYGRSSGRPSVAAMISDAQKILNFVVQWLETHGYTGPLIVMGRSLGSAPALSLAAQCQERVDGLIVESGFATISPLLRLLGVETGGLGLNPQADAFNLNHIQAFSKPTLIIHAQFDHIIAFSAGQALFDASPAREKRLLMIPGANHNDIFHRGLDEYLQAVRWLVGAAGG